MPPWGAELALRMGDSDLGVEHALLAMMRRRETVPARALAGLADLDQLEAAVLGAKDTPPGPGPDAVILPEGQRMDGPLRQAVIESLPEGATFGFNSDEHGRSWMRVWGPGESSDPAVSRRVLDTALSRLGRPTLDS